MFRFIAALALLAPLWASAEAPFSFETTPGKLPKTVVPVDYRFTLRPDLQKLTFDGSETVAIQVSAAVSEIVLNANALQIRSASLTGANLPAVTLTPVLEADAQLLKFALAAPLPPGAYTLAIEYSGVINPGTEGLFYEKYRTPAGQRTLLGTQFESTDARRLLPCWDEPSFRATFQLGVELPKVMAAYSNTPIEHTEDAGKTRRLIRFARTPKMASYLLVLVAGELERLAGDSDGVNQGVVTTAGKKASGAVALGDSQQILHFYNDYFGVPYPLPKLDHFAVPSTGGFGAMENWGGILYGESYLLFDPKHSAESTRRTVFEVVAHEMAHQWFGDLVTMAWWDNLWLNEGFASWMGTKATDQLHPDWQPWLAATQGRERAMSLDARSTTHPIQQVVRTESEANDAFDSITYLKGQSFLRMLEQWLGPERFRDGIRGYIAAHAYSNTTTADLWNALEKASGQPVVKMAHTWTEEPGFPVVHVESHCDRGSRALAFSQQQFRVDGEPGARLWTIPLALSAAEALLEPVLLEAATTTVSRPGCDGPLVVDPDAVGYFRVEYAPDLFAELAAKLPQQRPATRLKLLADAWALAGVGRLPLSSYLGLPSRLKDETEPEVWNEVLSAIGKLDLLAEGEALQPALRGYAIALLRPEFDRLGWQARPGEPQPVRELRAALVNVLGHFGDEQVVAQARQRFAAFLKRPASLDPTLIEPVVEIVGRNADEKTYEQLRRLLRAATTSEEKNRYLNAIGVVHDPALAQRTLALSLSDELLPAQATLLPRIVAEERVQRAQAWSFAKAHREELTHKLVAFQYNGYYGGLMGSASDNAAADELVAFARANLRPEAMTETERSASGIRFNAQLKTRLLPQLAQALEKKP